MNLRDDAPHTPAFVTIPEWCHLSGMGRTVTYQALSDGHLQARKLGKRTLIDVKHGLAWMGSLPLASVRVGGMKKEAA